jgi:UDP-N-acetylglucosamine diphosphorylase/glucosamine-1-phosphate N-acetyltransferase
MQVVLFDDQFFENLHPLTYTRPIADLRVGILTIRQKWEMITGEKVSVKTNDTLAYKWPLDPPENAVYVNASYLPEAEFLEQLASLESEEAIVDEDRLVAYCCSAKNDFSTENFSTLEIEGHPQKIMQVWDIFTKNHQAIQDDFKRITKGRKTQALPDDVTAINPSQIFVEEGATVLPCTLNATDGPIYIGRNATIMEGCLVRGALAICESATLKMGAKMYNGTTIGPYSKVGGEVSNSIITGFSNKAHDGFLGNSVIGEWCNIGADTNTSNLKNNYTSIKLWNYRAQRFLPSHQQFCGLIMGDHSKCGINTMFNTGTVVGINANIFGGGFPRNFFPSFSWGGSHGFKTYQLNKALEVADVVMKRRQKTLKDEDRHILTRVFDETAKFRS